MRILILPKTETAAPEKPKDYKFMEKSERVLANIPAIWKQYPYTEEGLMSIVEMEYNELKAATSTEQKKHELVHLASACLYLWRRLSNVD